MENSLIYNLASVLKRLRARRGWSQLDLALKAGVDRRYMSDVENGKRNVSIDVLTRLSEAFGIPLSSLFREAERTQATESSDSLPTSSLEALRSWLLERDCEDTVILENPDYLSAILGISEDGRLIYSYDAMVEHLMLHDCMTCEEAMEFIDFNTIRAIPYMGQKAPIILYPIPD